MEADGSERDAEVNRPREESKTVPGRSAHLMMMMMMILAMSTRRGMRIVDTDDDYDDKL